MQVNRNRALAGQTLIWLFLFSGNPSSSSESGVWWTSRLHLKDLAELDARWNAPLEESIRVSKAGAEATISNCADREKLLESGYQATTDIALRTLRYEGADCAALECLRAAKPAKQSYVKGLELTPESVRQLPPAFAVSVSKDEEYKQNRAAKRGLSWLAYAPRMRVEKRGDSLITSEGGMRSTLTLYARADLNGDGLEDVLIRQDYAAEQGTYSGSRLFLLTRRGRGEMLQLIRQY